MGISNHGAGSQNHFQAIVWSLKAKNALQMLQFAELSQRNKGPSFYNLTFLLLSYAIAFKRRF